MQRTALLVMATVALVGCLTAGRDRRRRRSGSRRQIGFGVERHVQGRARVGRSGHRVRFGDDGLLHVRALGSRRRHVRDREGRDRPRHGGLPLSTDRRSLGRVSREGRRRRRREVFEARRAPRCGRLPRAGQAQVDDRRAAHDADRCVHRRWLCATAPRLHAARTAHGDAGAVRRPRPVADQHRSRDRQRGDLARCPDVPVHGHRYRRSHHRGAAARRRRSRPARRQRGEQQRDGEGEARCRRHREPPRSRRCSRSPTRST